MSAPSTASWAPDPSLPGYVTDGGLETDLIFHHGIDLPEFAAFPLLFDAAGRDLLTSYYEAYAGIAAAAGAGMLLETPTWRANSEWGARIGVDAAGLARANASAVSFMTELGGRIAGEVPEVVVAGMLGPRGDGYVAGEAMHPEQARDYHRPQVRVFADAGADLITALTLTTAEEAVGIVLAAREVGLPVTVAFTVETDGRLPDGSTLRETIERVDAAGPPDHFVVNCAHPSHVARALGDGGRWLERIVGTRVNASSLSHEELDAAEALDEGDPDILGRDQADLAAQLPALQVVGGCCGTDVRHVAAMWGVPLDSPRA